MVGKQAKFKGKDKKWWKTQTLYWKGVPFDRNGFFYQELLDRAYTALSENEGFRRALMATGTSSLTHSLGKSDPKRTVLTEREFCSRLEILREHYKTKQEK